jgi:hypothetical protein
MKHLFKTAIVVAVITASFVSLSAFISKKKAAATSTDAYQIVLVTKNTVGANYEWTWSLANPNPGNGQDGTLQDVSHWSVPLTPDAEAALVSAETSDDGVNWQSVATVIERDPSIRQCTSVDVLKYDVGTTGSAVRYYRASFNADFIVNPFATSWIKNGGGAQGCNLYYFSGTGTRLD